jgi:hypothetical protein
LLEGSQIWLIKILVGDSVLILRHLHLMYLVSAAVAAHVLHVHHHLVLSLRVKFSVGVHLRVGCPVDRLVVASDLELRTPMLTGPCARLW